MIIKNKSQDSFRCVDISKKIFYEFKPNEHKWSEEVGGANIVKYITRHNKKGEGKKDILKVIHYAQLLLELEYPEEDAQADLFNDLIERCRHVQVKS